MKRVTRLTSIGILTFVVALAGATIQLQKPAAVQAAGTAPVTVMNTPLPVSLSGTGTISGNVNAAQSGVWNVGVTNLPAVQLAAGASVTVNSSPAAPIYTLDISAQQAFAVTLCDSTSVIPCAFEVDDVALPAGKRFVIEQVSGICKANGSLPATFYISAWLDGQPYVYYTSGVQGLVAAGDTNRILVGAQTRLYAETSVGISRFEDDTDQCQVTLSGHLVAIS